MATNTPYMSGSPYPTGRSPFAVNLSQNIAAITQQMVENRQNEIKENKIQVEENEATLLKALDFKTVDGIQDKVALDHANRIKAMSDKWAVRMKERQGILNNNDKLELLKDKRDIETRLAKAASDVATVKTLQEDLAKDKNFVFEKFPTATNLNKYIEEGRIGEGNAINIAEMKIPAFGYEFMQFYEPFVANKAKNFKDDVRIVNPSTGQVSTTRSNREAVDEAIEFIKSNSYQYKELEAEDPKKAEEVVEYLRIKYRSVSEEDKFVAGARPRGTGSGKKEDTAVNQAIEDFNKNVVGVMNFDTTAMGKFRSEDWGGIDDMRRSTRGKKDYVRVTYKEDKVGDKKPPIDIAIPDKLYDEETGQMTEEGKAFYQKMWELYPASLKQGIDKKPLADLMNPAKVPSREYSVDQPIQKEQLLDSFKNIDDTSSNDEVRQLVDNINNTFGGDITVEYTKKGAFTANGITFNGQFYSRKRGGEKTIGRDLKKDMEVYLGLNLLEPKERQKAKPKMFQ